MDSQAAVDAIPAPQVVGTILNPKKVKENYGLIVFKPNSTTNLLLGDWAVSCDSNHLGTTVNPMPFKLACGGHGSGKYAAHISGHFGKSQPPWPFVALTATLLPGGGAVDLSGFKSIEFWVKGDGKDYSFSINRAAVQDYCEFRQEFKALPQSTKIKIRLSDLTQPAWGKQIPLKLNDVMYLTFSPGASFSDEDYDFWLDDVVLVK